ncbi:hypothetical protein FRC03_003408 [Tulasnella sp. 419]|nr:hypothetical protein FRC03_003408 [Tulasnella sp. 419]
MVTPAELTANNIFGIKGWVALVTGGGTGIGLMIGQTFAANGATVYLAGRRKDVVERAARGSDFSQQGGELIAVELDITSKESIKKAVQVISDKEGRLDILVNNAGQVGPRSPFFSDSKAPENASAGTLGTALFETETFEQWGDLLSVNVSSIFFTTMAFLDLLEKGSKARQGSSSSVINIGSISGIMKLCQQHFAYNASKAAVHHLTKMMATEFGLKGHAIRVNAIAPGVYPSELTASAEEIDNGRVDQISNAIVPTPIQRGGRAQDIGATALYLASPAGAYVTGEVLVSDGGFLAVNPSRD